MSKLDEIVETFATVDPPVRLELLLEYAEKLPPLPEAYRQMRDAGLNRVPECQTPVFLWIEVRDGRVEMVADAAPEAPSVKGFVSLLAHAFSGAPVDEVLDAPSDLLYRMGLAQVLGMTRMRGLDAVLRRIKREASVRANVSRS